MRKVLDFENRKIYVQKISYFSHRPNSWLFLLFVHVRTSGTFSLLLIQGAFLQGVVKYGSFTGVISATTQGASQLSTGVELSNAMKSFPRMFLERKYEIRTEKLLKMWTVGTTEQNNGNADFIGHAFTVLWTSFLPHTHTLVCCVIVSRRKKVLCLGLFDLMSQRAPCVAVPWLTYMVTPDKLFWCHFLPLISFLLPSDVNTTNFYFSWPSSALIVFVLILNIVSLIGQVTLSENTSFKDHGIVIWDFVTLDNTSVKTNWDGEI